MGTRMGTRYTVTTMRKVPTVAEASERWAQYTTRWALKRAAQGALADGVPSALWVFDGGLRKVTRRARNTAAVNLSRQMLQHLGVGIADLVMVLPRKDGTLVIRKATAQDLRQANPYTRLTAVAGRRDRSSRRKGQTGDSLTAGKRFSELC
jgi:hypothetical protein